MNLNCGGKEGYDNVLREFPNIQIVAMQTGKWYRNEAMAVMENWLQANLSIDAVVAEKRRNGVGCVEGHRRRRTAG